jgi:hypothetical protein
MGEGVPAANVMDIRSFAALTSHRELRGVNKVVI